jgi:hypothetical protein
MDKSIAMKQQVLGMLKDFMMGEQGKKIKPRAIEVSMMTTKPKNLDEVLDRASKNEYGREPMTEEQGDIDGDGDHDMHDHALEKEAEMYEDAREGEMEDRDEEEEVKPKMSLKEFFKRK